MFSTRICALALAGVCLTAFTCEAAFLRPRLRGQAVAQAAKKESQKESNEQLREALQVLRVTKKTLEGADHDYGGHRVEAIKDIGAAEHQLRLALHHAHPGKKPGTGTGGGKGAGSGKGEPEPQAVSDAQLAKSIPVLRTAIHVLKNANHDYGGHREKAVEDLHKAIGQLEKALKYSKEHDQNKK
jgi:hypothetical protein